MIIQFIALYATYIPKVYFDPCFHSGLMLIIFPTWTNLELAS